jgi:hypothetical protein
LDKVAVWVFVHEEPGAYLACLEARPDGGNVAGWRDRLDKAFAEPGDPLLAVIVVVGAGVDLESEDIYCYFWIVRLFSATRDSSSIKAITIITMAFLLGTFLAALFAVLSLNCNVLNQVLPD